MVRNQLQVNVPSVFRCPISLDVMRSPVSLCTGITYDRSSIQHWLEAGHDTCPATMQVLDSKDVVPNLTVRRLINLWVQTSARRSDAVSEEVAKDLMEKIRKETCVVESLSKVVEFVSSGEDNRRFIARFGGFVEVIVGVLGKNSAEVEALGMVIRVLDSISSENGMKELLNRLILKSNQENNCLSSIVSIIRNGNLNSQIRSVRLLELIALDGESKRKIAETPDLLLLLLRLLRTTTDLALIDTISSLLISIAETRTAKILLVQNGIVSILSKHLTDQGNKNHNKAMKLLEIASTCSEGRLSISEDRNCAAGIVERLFKVSKPAAEDGVTVLWRMCCVYKDERVKEAVVKTDAVSKLLMVMQREGEGMVKSMCGALVKAVMAGRKDGYLVSYQTKSTHIMPC